MPLSTVIISAGSRCAASATISRREPVAELKAVGYEEIDLRAHRAQAAHADRTGGGAVSIVVGDDQQTLASFDRAGEPRGRGVDAL